MNKKQEEEIQKIAADLGRRGGLAKARKYGKKHMSEIGKKGALSRWAKFKLEKIKKDGKKTTKPRGTGKNAVN